MVWSKEHNSESDGGFTVSSSTHQTTGLLDNMLLLRPSVMLICKNGYHGTPGERIQWDDKMPSTAWHVTGTQSMVAIIFTAQSQILVRVHPAKYTQS